METHNITINEIFNTKAVYEVETEILSMQYSADKKHSWLKDCEQATVTGLLRIRKSILNDMFVMDKHYKNLLTDFNEKLKRQLIDIRLKTIKLYESVKDIDTSKDMLVSGKCFLGYEYPKIHPIQTIRAKKMWAILNGTINDFIPLYKYDGAGNFQIHTGTEPEKIQSVNEMLYLGETQDNWDEGLDRNFTKDMNLIYPFHNLYDHMEFSIFDLLWVRNFNMELSVEASYDSYNGDYGDDLDWEKCDYLD